MTTARAANEPASTFAFGSFAEGELGVVKAHGREGVSRPFEFEVELAAKLNVSVDVRAAIGQPATLRLALHDGQMRSIHGVLRQFGRVGERKEHALYRALLVPPLWKLGLGRQCRIFQHLSAAKIVGKILDQHGIAHRWAGSEPPAREFCVQYRESDLAFVSRLLEWHGLAYWFEHGDEKTVLVLGALADTARPIAGKKQLLFREPTSHSSADQWVATAFDPDPFESSSSSLKSSGMITDEGHVFQLFAGNQIRSGAAVLDDFDFERPALDLHADHSAGEEEEAALEVYEYPGQYVDPTLGKKIAQVRLEQLRHDADILLGGSVSPRLEAGRTFELDDAPAHFAGGELWALEVVHWLHQPQVLAGEASFGGLEDQPLYVNAFRALPTSVTYRPPRLWPWPVVAGIQTATVVGPAGEEIYTDKYGRVKVQFHWDREGKHDAESSCWVRVKQAWAGVGFGALYLPRIGQEVVVRFLEGDPDRPIIVGSVYNGRNPTPLGLPGEKQKSTLRSQSSPGGGGSNELQFDDTAGAEKIFLHGQKDEQLRIEHDKTQSVGHDESLSVGNDRSKTVGGNQELGVKNDDSSDVGGNQKLSVTQNRSVFVGGDHDETVAQKQSVTIGGMRSIAIDKAASENVGGAKALSIGAGYLVNVGAASSELIGGLRSRQVGGLSTESVEAFRTEVIVGSRSATSGGDALYDIGESLGQSVKADAKLDVGGHFLAEAKSSADFIAKKIEGKAEELAIVVDGELRLMINKSGTLKLFAEKFTLDGGSDVKFKGGKVQREAGGSGASKSFKEVLTDAVEIENYDGKQKPKGMSDADFKGFKDGKMSKKMLTKPTSVKRLCGGTGKPGGRWVTLGDRPTGLEGKIRMALRPEWGNEAAQVAEMELPAGTIVYEGEVAAQGGPYAGKAAQILVSEAPAGKAAEIAAAEAAGGPGAGRAAFQQWMDSMVTGVH